MSKNEKDVFLAAIAGKVCIATAENVIALTPAGFQKLLDAGPRLLELAQSLTNCEAGSQDIDEMALDLMTNKWRWSQERGAWLHPTLSVPCEGKSYSDGTQLAHSILSVADNARMYSGGHLP